MAFPADGVESTYRNYIEDVAKFLDERHMDRYLIFNLSGRDYNYERFGGKVPFTLNLLFINSSYFEIPFFFFKYFNISGPQLVLVPGPPPPASVDAVQAHDRHGRFP